MPYLRKPKMKLPAIFLVCVSCLLAQTAQAKVFLPFNFAGCTNPEDATGLGIMLDNGVLYKAQKELERDIQLNKCFAFAANIKLIVGETRKMLTGDTVVCIHKSETDHECWWIHEHFLQTDNE